MFIIKNPVLVYIYIRLDSKIKSNVTDLETVPCQCLKYP